MSPVSIVFSTGIRFKIGKYTYRISKKTSKMANYSFFFNKYDTRYQNLKIQNQQSNVSRDRKKRSKTAQNSPKSLKIFQNSQKRHKKPLKTKKKTQPGTPEITRIERRVFTESANFPSTHGLFSRRREPFFYAISGQNDPKNTDSGPKNAIFSVFAPENGGKMAENGPKMAENAANRGKARFGRRHFEKTGKGGEGNIFIGEKDL
jgi:hypothetical protein